MAAFSRSTTEEYAIYTARSRRRTWVAGIVAALASLAIAPAAWAHAVLEESRPSNDSIVQVSPAQVTLRFSESIDTSPSAIRVFAADGARVDDGSIERPDANVASVGLEPRLADGTYTVTWRVVSADTHPVAGAFVFHVGAPGAQPGGIAEQVLQSTATSRTVSIAFTTIRFLSYALIFLCVGGMTGIALVLGRASEATRRRLLGLVAGCAGGLVVVSLVGIVLQAAESAGVGILDALRWPRIDEVLGTRFGQVWLARAVLGLLLVIGAIALRRARGRAAELTLDAALVVCAGLVLTPAAAGHSNGGAASFISDVVHVQAGAVWIGGLAFVLLALLFERTRRWELASDAVPRFSTIAVISVAALLVAGLVNAYLQVRSWSGLWETTYGRLILVKAGLLLPDPGTRRLQQPKGSTPRSGATSPLRSRSGDSLSPRQRSSSSSSPCSRSRRCSSPSRRPAPSPHRSARTRRPLP